MNSKYQKNKCKHASYRVSHTESSDTEIENWIQKSDPSTVYGDDQQINSHFRVKDCLVLQKWPTGTKPKYENLSRNGSSEISLSKQSRVFIISK